jgi:hypothetical protein
MQWRSNTFSLAAGEREREPSGQPLLCPGMSQQPRTKAVQLVKTLKRAEQVKCLESKACLTGMPILNTA